MEIQADLFMPYSRGTWHRVPSKTDPPLFCVDRNCFERFIHPWGHVGLKFGVQPKNCHSGLEKKIGLLPVGGEIGPNSNSPSRWRLHGLRAMRSSIKNPLGSDLATLMG